jgi:hypothetical protein
MPRPIDPDPDPGLYVLATAERTTAIHDFALSALPTAAEAYWIDARNTAATHALYGAASDERHLRGLRVARAFTAYQHHRLVRNVVERAGPRTALVVAPNVESLYGDDDLADWEAADLLEATLTCLAELAAAAGIPVLCTTAGEGERARACREHAGEVIECRETRFGHAFDGAGVETTAYRLGGFWQTTIPYWLDRCGSVADVEVPTAPGATTLQRPLEV